MTQSNGFAGVVVRGAGLTGVGFVLTQALNLGFSLALARLATPQEFGHLAAGGIVAVIAPAFAESGMMSALIQRGDERLEEAANTALIATLLAGSGLSVLALAAAPLVGAFFGNHEIELVAIAMAPWPLLRGAVAVPDALMQRRFSFARRMIVDPLSALNLGVISVIATSMGLGVWGLVLGMYAWAVTRLIATWGLARWRPQPRLASFTMWRELARFGRHIVAGEVVSACSSNLDAVLLGRIVNAGAIGQYRYGLKIAQAPVGAWGNLAFVLLPAFSRMSHDIERMRAAFLRTLRWLSIASIPLSFILFPLGVPLAVILFGSPWRPAGVALMAMCAIGAGQSIVSISNEVFKASGRPDFLPRLQLIAAVLSAGLMLALVPLGLTGVAAAGSIAAVGVAICALRWLTRVLDVTWRALLRVIWQPLVASLVMALSVFPVERFLVHADRHSGFQGLGLLAVETALAVAIYVACLSILAPSTIRDLVEEIRTARSSRRQTKSTPSMDHGSSTPSQ
jgi:O-antigen/teichoic acid export membrane protein